MYDDYEFDGQESGLSTIVGVLILCALILGGAIGLIWYLQGPYVGRQFISALVQPIGIFWVLLFFGALTATFTKQKFLAFLLWAMMISLSMLGNNSIANSLIAGLESPQRANVENAEGTYDYGFVLGGGVSQNKYDEFDFNASGERVEDAIRLYKRGVVKHLVFTGSPFLYSEDEAKSKATDSTSPISDEADDQAETATSDETTAEESSGDLDSDAAEDGGDEEAPGSGPWAQDDVEDEVALVATQASDNQSVYEQSFRKMLKDRGVAESDYSFIGGRYTAEEMLRIDEFLKDHPNSNCAMITSAWHMTRAAKLRLAQGLDMKSIPVDFRSVSVKEDPTFFVPKIDPLYNSSVAIKEYLAGWIQ